MRKTLFSVLIIAVALLVAHLCHVRSDGLPFLAFGTLTLEDAVAVKQRCRLSLRRPGVAEQLGALFKHLVGKNERKLQFVAIDQTSNADAVIADVACRLFALVLKKPTGSTVTSWFKGSDHATVASADPDICITLQDALEHAFIDPDGLPLSTGLTVAAHTSISGSTDSLDADAPQGFAVIGAA